MSENQSGNYGSPLAPGETHPNYPESGYYGDKYPLPAHNYLGPKKRRAWLIPAGIAALALLLGISIGVSGRPAPVTIEKTVEKPVNVTPPACTQALDLYEQAMDGLSTSLGYIMDGNYSAAGTNTAKVKALAPRVNAAKAECRASTK